MASFSYENLFGLNDLNPNAFSQNVTEDSYTSTINFNYIYNNDNSPDVIFDYNVRISSGNNITAQIDGNIIARGGDLNSRFIKAQNYAKTINLYSLVVPFYNDFYPYNSTAPLNPKPISSGTSYSQSEGLVSLNAVFGNQDQVDNGLDSFEYVLDFRPSIAKIDVAQKVDGASLSPFNLYSLVDLGYRSRSSLTINGNAIINQLTSPTVGVDLIQKKCMALMLQYATTAAVVLDDNKIVLERTDKRRVGFTFSWSFESPNPVAQNPYTTVSTLNVK